MPDNVSLASGAVGLHLYGVPSLRVLYDSNPTGYDSITAMAIRSPMSKPALSFLVSSLRPRVPKLGSIALNCARQLKSHHFPVVFRVASVDPCILLYLCIDGLATGMPARDFGRHVTGREAHL